VDQRRPLSEPNASLEATALVDAGVNGKEPFEFR
jgi:hypothetical protein